MVKEFRKFWGITANEEKGNVWRNLHMYDQTFEEYGNIRVGR